MNKTSKILVGLLLIIVILLIGSSILGRNKSNNSDTIKIGAILPLTGFGAYWGEPVQKGIQLAVDEINQEYGTSTLSLVFEDDQSDVKGAANAANKLISIDKVRALYSEFSGLSSVVSPIAMENKIPLMYSAFNQQIVLDNPLAIKTFMNYEDACDVYGKYAKASGIKRIAVINKITDVAPFCIKSLKKYFNEEDIVLEDNFKGNDFKTILLRFKQEKIDTIIPLMYESDSHILIKQKNDLLIPATLFCDKQDCATEKIINDVGIKNLEGLVYFEGKISNDFKNRFEDRYGTINSIDDMQPAGYSYDAIRILFDALYQCKNKNSDCISNYFTSNKVLTISKALENVSFSNRVLSAKIEFTEIKKGERVELNIGS